MAITRIPIHMVAIHDRVVTWTSVDGKIHMTGDVEIIAHAKRVSAEGTPFHLFGDDRAWICSVDDVDTPESALSAFCSYDPTRARIVKSSPEIMAEWNAAFPEAWEQPLKAGYEINGITYGSSQLDTEARSAEEPPALGTSGRN